MALVGRGAEQSAITDLVEGARHGRSGVLAIVGEPGVGKSALLNLGIELAAGMNVLRARGVQSEAQIPFAGLSDLLRPALRHLDQIPPRQKAALEGALAMAPARTEERFAVGAATLSLLSAYAEELPVLVVVDDVQWVDGSSADALLFAFRRLIADPVAVLLGARAGEPSLLEGSDVRRMRLEGLDIDATSVLLSGVAGPVPPDLVARLHRHTGGNPLALIEAAAEIDRFRHGAPLDVPLPILSRVSEVYTARVRALGASSRTLLLLAAASDIGETSVLARAAGLLDIDFVGLAEAEDLGLVEVRESQVEFRHPLIRSAVYSVASPKERRQVHKALARALPDAEADRRAWHLALSAMGPDDDASSALEQVAMRSRERNAYDVASRTFERAAGLATSAPRQAILFYEAAAASWEAGQGPHTMDLLDRAEKGATSSDLAIAVQHLRGQAASRLGPVSEGLSVLVRAAKLASRSDPERAAVVLSEAVNTAFYAGDAEAMRSIAGEIAAIEPHLCAGRAKFFATMAQGMALIFSGRPERGAALLHGAVEQALQGAQDEDDPKWMTWAAMGPIWLREGGAARALVDRAADVARSRTAFGLLPYLLSHVAIDHATTSRWAEAEAAFYEAIRISEETQQRTDRAAALARLAWLEARQGKEQSCVEHASDAIRLADELHLVLCKIWALSALGDLEFTSGRATEAIAHFKQQRELLERAKIADVDLSPAPELVELHLRQGRREEAASVAIEYHDRAVAKGLPWALARAIRCQALLADDQHIDELFMEALAAHAQTPDIFETARTYLAYGARLRRSRHRAEARKQLHAAMDIFDELGARPWSTIARSELAATGDTARRRNESTRYRLTPQELQIALLLAAKHTTKQTAAALFLSPKTVEYHLRSIYRKLGCNTREELSSALKTT